MDKLINYIQSLDLDLESMAKTGSVLLLGVILSSLAFVLDQIRIQKEEGGEAPAAAAAEAAQAPAEAPAAEAEAPAENAEA